MTNQPRKTSNIVKIVGDVEETIPDFYGPQKDAPEGAVKKGDTWYVTDQARIVLTSAPIVRMRPLEIRNYSEPTKPIKLNK